MKIKSLFYFVLAITFLLSCQKKEESISSVAGTVTDIEGNVYKAVTIGTQTWMVENLKTTKLSDGTSIALKKLVGVDIITPAYCWYNNDLTNKDKYGAYYNWYAVSSGKLCPSGWHVPTVAEWTTLVTYVGGENVAGGKLKENTAYTWQSSIFTSTNEYGFSALPGGDTYGTQFREVLKYGYWWSSTLEDNKVLLFFGMSYNDNGLWMCRNSLTNSYSVSARCMKN